MNMPCDNCKTIRPFSGQPLRCDVCGWECGASSRDDGYRSSPDDSSSHDKFLSGFQGQTRALRKEVVSTDPETRTDVPHREAESLWTGEQKVALGALLRVGICGLVIVGAGFLLVQFLAREKHPDLLTPGKYQLALKYNLTEDQVFMDEKPKGCDFTDAPMGDKHCHYEQSLNVVRECLTPNCPVKRVYVSWQKVRD